MSTQNSASSCFGFRRVCGRVCVWCGVVCYGAVCVGGGRRLYPGAPGLWAVETCRPAAEVLLGPLVPELGAVLPLQAVSSSCNITTREAASTDCGPWERGIT